MKHRLKHWNMELAIGLRYPYAVWHIAEYRTTLIFGLEPNNIYVF